ncbi:hypothetical protein Q9233_016453 [Columba guinea]|nr:hypothetical protein Q9233_016453 [Columba guinea]
MLPESSDPQGFPSWPLHTGGCKAPSKWDPKLQFTPNQSSYAVNDLVQLSCAGEYVPSVPQIRCISNGMQTLWNETATCEETCQRPLWDSRLQLSPDQENYKKNEEVVLSCPEGFQPSFTHVRCLGQEQPISNWNPVYRELWQERDSRGSWINIQTSVECIEICQKPHWDSRLRLAPDKKNYKKNEEVTLSCPEGFQPPFTLVKCGEKVQSVSRGQPVYRGPWLGKDSRGSWISIQSDVECLEKCHKPQWDPRFIFEQDQVFYDVNEEVMMKCPEGYWSSTTEIKCMKLNPRQGSTTSRSIWLVKNVTGRWHPVEGNMTCVEVLQVVPGTLEISSTSIKLNWTCRLRDACQNMKAMCSLAVPSSPPCEAEEVKGEEILQGQAGTFTCPPLQPFTVYIVTILLPPRTILYTRHFTTKETVPDKLEKLWLDPSTGFLRWKPLPSCKGEIIGYQLNITSWRAHDGSFLEFTQVLVNQSVTQYAPPHQAPGSKYMVTVQGLTAAGAGAVSVLEFQSFFSVAGEPLGLWPGMAVTVVVVLSVLVLLSAGILWAVLSRKKKTLPKKAEEDHYTELQPYENLDNYCVIKETLLGDEDAGKGGLAGKPLPQPLPVLESSRDSQRKEKMERMFKAPC